MFHTMFGRSDYELNAPPPGVSCPCNVSAEAREAASCSLVRPQGSTDSSVGGRSLADELRLLDPVKLERKEGPETKHDALITYLSLQAAMCLFDEAEGQGVCRKTFVCSCAAQLNCNEYVQIAGGLHETLKNESRSSKCVQWHMSGVYVVLRRYRCRTLAMLSP